MADNEYVIRLKVTRDASSSQAIAAQKADHADMERAIRDAMKATAQMEKQAARERVQAAKEAAKEKVQAEREVAAQAKAFQRDLDAVLKQGLAEARQREKERVQARRDADRDIAQSAREAARIDNRLLKDSEVAARAQAEAFKRMNEARIKSMADTIAPTERSISATEALTSRLSGAAGTAAAFGGLALAIRGVGQGLSESMEKAKQLATELQNDVDKRREFLGLVGGKPSVEESIQAATARAGTGATAEESRSIQTGLAARAASYIGPGKSLDEAGGKKYAQDIEALTIAKGLPTEATGTFAGAVLGSEDFRGDENAAFGAAAKATAILQRGAGDFGTLAREFGQTSGLVGPDKRIGSSVEHSALISAGAEFGEGRAGTNLEALQRAVSGFGAGDKQSPILRRAGIGGTTNLIESIEKLGPAIRSEASASGKTQREIIDKYFTNAEEARSVEGYIDPRAGKGLSAIQDRLKFAEGITAEGTRAEVGKMQADPSGPLRMRIAAAKEDAAKLRAGRREFPLQPLRAEASADLYDSGYDTGPFSFQRTLDSAAATVATPFGYKGSGRDLAIDRRFRRRQGLGGPVDAMREAAGPLGNFTPLGGLGAVADMYGALGGTTDAFHASGRPGASGDPGWARTLTDAANNLARAIGGKGATPPAMPKGGGAGGEAVRPGS